MQSQMPSSYDAPMELRKPVVIYNAETNLQAHLIAAMLADCDIPGYVVEDQSGVSLWMMGTITQFHQPQIWVEESAAKRAAELIRVFEKRNTARGRVVASGDQLQTVCEDCGRMAAFSASYTGTTQDCPHCPGYVDVGSGDQPLDNGVTER